MMIRQVIAEVVAILALLVLTLPVSAQLPSTPPASGPFVDVIHMDIIPPSAAQGLALLKAYRQESLSDPGLRRIEVLRQEGLFHNHFTVIEEWDSQSAYNKHISAAHTLRFRKDLEPMLGSPFDERPHSVINADS